MEGCCGAEPGAEQLTVPAQRDVGVVALRDDVEIMAGQPREGTVTVSGEAETIVDGDQGQLTGSGRCDGLNGSSPSTRRGDAKVRVVDDRPHQPNGDLEGFQELSRAQVADALDYLLGVWLDEDAKRNYTGSGVLGAARTMVKTARANAQKHAEGKTGKAKPKPIHVHVEGLKKLLTEEPEEAAAAESPDRGSDADEEDVDRRVILDLSTLKMHKGLTSPIIGNGENMQLTEGGYSGEADMDELDFGDGADEQITIIQGHGIDPNHPARMCFDLAGMILIGIDAVFIPFSLSFEADEDQKFNALFWIPLIFWQTDMILSCISGFYEKGALVLSVPRIVQRYCMSWFIIDLVVVGCDWMTLVFNLLLTGANAPSSATRLMRTARVFRILRSLRLLRLAKLKRLLEEVRDRMNSDMFDTILEVVKLVLFILFLNHVFCCAWFALGSPSQCWGLDPTLSADELHECFKHRDANDDMVTWANKTASVPAYCAELDLAMFDQVRMKNCLIELGAVEPENFEATGQLDVSGLCSEGDLTQCVEYPRDYPGWPYSASWRTHYTFNDGTSSKEFKYLTSLHWSLTQFTPASMEVMPRNVKERAMAVVVLVFALIIFGSFISSLTACVTKLRDMSIDTSRQFSLLRRFLNSSGLPPDLKVRIRKFLEWQMYSETQTMSEKDVKVLKLLSQPLATELTYHRMRPTLTRCPLLLLLDYQCKATSRHIAMNACKEVQVAAGDLVFTPGEDAQQMMILSRGKLKYVESRSQEVRMLRRGARVAELALLYQWTFRGSGIALTSVDMITINAPAFIRSVMQFSQAHDLTLRFGRMFLEKVKKHPENLTLFGDVLDAVPLMEAMFSELCGENADLGVSDRSSFWSPTGERRTVAPQHLRPEPTLFDKIKAIFFGKKDDPSQPAHG